VGLQGVGPYVIERRLATGGMAEVFVAQRKGPHGFSKRVALKRILPQFAADPDFVGMFIDEAKLAAMLQHPGLVSVFDFGEQGGELFLAMELVEGTNLNRLLRACSARGEVVPIDVALYVVTQLARALAYAHRLSFPNGEPMGFVHRDVSPANILLTHTGHVKLSDFGIATRLGRSRMTEDGHVRGKLGYMSPEQVMGRDVDGRSDVFTLATVLGEMLVGEPLFGSGSELDILVRIRDVDLSVLHTSDRKVPRDVRRLLLTGLEHKPVERPTARDFADAADEIRRRRGMGHAPDRLARLLARVGLVDGPDAEAALDAPGGRVTSFFDTSVISPAAEEIVADVGIRSPNIYRAKVGELELGPMSFPKLVQLFTSGRVDSDTPISKEGSAFAPAKILPELTRFVMSPALSWRLEEIARADQQGDIAAGALLPVFFQIMRERRTGVLHAWGDVRRKKVYFVEGKPEFVGSTDRRELLGEYLVEHGYCLRMEVEMALALLPRYGGRLGDALVGLGILRPVELFRAITSQVRWRLLELFRWRAGHWAFIEGLRSHEETLPIADDGYELLRDAVDGAHSEELQAILEPHWERLLVPVAAPPVPIASFELPARWARVLTEVRGDSTIGGIVGKHTGKGAKKADVMDAYQAIVLALAADLALAVDPD